MKYGRNQCQVEIALFVCVVSYFLCYFCLRRGGGDGERLRQLPWIHKPFKLQFPPSTLYTLCVY